VASGGPRSRLGFRGGGSVGMAKYMDLRSGFTGLTADLLRRARRRAVVIGEAGAGHLD